MKTDIICDDEYEAQKLMSLIFIKEDKETFITGILNVIKNEMIISLKDKSAHSILLKDEENVEKFAQDRRVPFSDFASLCRTEPVIELIKGIIDDVNKNFARVEQIKDFRLIDTLLTAEDDELTATMKLKRSFVEQKYQSLIDEMYQ